jgi:hypothetical protein
LKVWKEQDKNQSYYLKVYKTQEESNLNKIKNLLKILEYLNKDAYKNRNKHGKTLQTKKENQGYK